MDIQTAYKKILWYLKIELIFLLIIALLFGLLFIFNSLLGIGGIFIIGEIIFGFTVVLISMVFLYSIRAFKLYHGLKRTMVDGGIVVNEPLLIGKCKNVYYTLLIINAICIIAVGIYAIPRTISSRTVVGENENQQERILQDQESQQNYINDQIGVITSNLNAFKQSANSAKDIYPEISQIPNDGSCVNPTVNSFFNFNLDPRLMKTDGSEDFIENFTKYISFGLGESHCYSTSEHYAFQVSNEYENPYLNFYCVDDIHPDIQIGKKPINGPSCDDVDNSYIPVKRKSNLN